VDEYIARLEQKHQEDLAAQERKLAEQAAEAGKLQLRLQTYQQQDHELARALQMMEKRVMSLSEAEELRAKVREQNAVLSHAAEENQRLAEENHALQDERVELMRRIAEMQMLLTAESARPEPAPNWPQPAEPQPAEPEDDRPDWSSLLEGAQHDAAHMRPVDEQEMAALEKLNKELGLI